jgi:hypothetical protein
MKTSRRRGDRGPEAALAGNSITGASAAALSHDRIAQRSFDLFCARGCEHGYDVDDWLEAERELQREAGSDGDQRVRA